MAKLKRTIHPMHIALAIAQGKTAGNLNWLTYEFKVALTFPGGIK